MDRRDQLRGDSLAWLLAPDDPGVRYLALRDLLDFANATWKAGQPFRNLSRITRDTFRPVTLLNEEELKKDFVQIQAAAAKLLEAMKR